MHKLQLDFQKLFESIPGKFIVFALDNRIVAVSDEYLKVAKKTRDEVINKDFFALFPQSLGETGTDILRQSFATVIKTGLPHKVPVRKVEDVYWASTNSPVLDDAGKVIAIIRRVDNVSDIVRQQQEQKTVEEERDMFFQNTFDLFAIVGTDGRFKRVNGAFKEILGYSAEDLEGHHISEFLHPDDLTVTLKRVDKLAQGIPAVSSVNRYRCKDGSWKYLSWNTVPRGDVMYTVGRDITEQKETEERITELNLKLAQKNEDLEEKIQLRFTELQKSEAQVQQLQKMDAVGRLAGGIAHDFNNILAAMSMQCDILADDADKPESIQAHARELRKMNDRAAALTRQLMLFSRQQVIKLQTVDLNPLVKNMELMLARLIGENIQLVTKLASDLRAVKIDSSQMEQVILNLVVNARDAMNNKGSITIETSNVYLDEAFVGTHLQIEPGHYVLLSVADEGYGMDASTIAKIFDPFFTTKPVGKGTGMGLSTTYAIVKQTKGTIWVYSEVGKGTVFKIYLPVAEKLPTDQAAPPPKVPTAVGKQTILLVEDDESLREKFEAILKKKGYQILTAANGEEALGIFGRFPGMIHLLLTDMVMPGLTGFQLANNARNLRPEIRVLYMSGYTTDILETSNIRNIQEWEFIQKPFDTATLLTKVHEVLERSVRR